MPHLPTIKNMWYTGRVPQEGDTERLLKVFMTNNSLPDTGNGLVEHVQQVCDCIDNATHELHNLHRELDVKAILFRQSGITSLRL